ncbi:MAG TPA: P1 family peptidase [Steroidobacteraceae bacterium]|nr:P1 family peptidase [Steroidobacteraceae bacterium]
MSSTVVCTLLAAGLLSSICTATAAEDKRPRLRDLGVTIGVFDPGPLNAITDVQGVRVGHVTLIEGERIRTGVTAIVPHAGNVFQDKVPAAAVVGNGFGKLMGTTQIMELGEIETPIVLTNTLAVAQAAEGVVRWTLAQPGNEGVQSVNAVVGETNDGRLNDIRARTITYQHAIDAIAQARVGPVAEGSVGAGTGTVAFGLKGGIGTSSRRLPQSGGGYTVGVLVQTNFGGLLTVAGMPLWKQLDLNPFAPEPAPPNAGSIMIVVACDAPLSDRNLERVARRALVGLARTGATVSNGSGDYVLAFSTAQDVRRTPAKRSALATVQELPNDAMTPLFQAVAEATEEAIVNSLLQARPMRSALSSVEALDPEAVRRALH